MYKKYGKDLVSIVVAFYLKQPLFIKMSALYVKYKKFEEEDKKGSVINEGDQ